MMKALLWKDFRCNQTMILSGFVLLPLIAVSIFVGIFLIIGGHDNDALGYLQRELPTITVAVLVLFKLVLILLGAQLFSDEKNSGTFNFLYYLPPNRKRVFLSKMLLAGIMLLVTITANLLYSLYFVESYPETMTITALFTTVGFALFGAAVLGSVIFKRAINAFGFSLALTSLFGWLLFCVLGSEMYVSACDYVTDLMGLDWAYQWASSATNILIATNASLIVFGCICVVVARWIFIRRIEP